MRINAPQTHVKQDMHQCKAAQHIHQRTSSTLKVGHRDLHCTSSIALDKLLEVLAATPTDVDGIVDSSRKINPRHDLTDSWKPTHRDAV
jgi:hypothetical protein